MSKVHDHPFRDLVTRADLFPDICGHDVDGMPCGFSRADHVQQEDSGDDDPLNQGRLPKGHRPTA